MNHQKDTAPFPLFKKFITKKASLNVNTSCYCTLFIIHTFLSKIESQNFFDTNKQIIKSIWIENIGLFNWTIYFLTFLLKQKRKVTQKKKNITMKEQEETENVLKTESWKNKTEQSFMIIF